MIASWPRATVGVLLTLWCRASLTLFVSVATITSYAQIPDPTEERCTSLAAKVAVVDARDQYQLGQCYALGRGVQKDNAEATKWFLKGGQRGLVAAQFRYANALLYGWGVIQSTSLAVEWYRTAAEHGHSQSADMLGQLYEDGGPLEVVGKPGEDKFALRPPLADTAIPKDLQKSTAWYRIAANGGNVHAQNRLGSFYLIGQGVPQNYEEAYFWLSLAEAGGIPSSTDGVDDREIAASHLTKTALSREQARTRVWFETHQAKSH